MYIWRIYIRIMFCLHNLRFQNNHIHIGLKGEYIGFRAEGAKKMREYIGFSGNFGNI